MKPLARRFRTPAGKGRRDELGRNASQLLRRLGDALDLVWSDVPRDLDDRLADPYLTQASHEVAQRFRGIPGMLLRQNRRHVEMRAQDLAGIAPDLSAGLVQELITPAHFGYRAGRVPAVGVAGHDAHHARPVRAEGERHTRLLQGRRTEGRLTNLVVRPLVGRDVLREKLV